MRLEYTDGLGKAAQVWVKGHLLDVCDGISEPGRRAAPGELEGVKLAYVSHEPVDWTQARQGNRSRKILLDPQRHWSYVGYGQVVQIMPAVIDFGVARMEAGDWTNDDSLVGAFVRVQIDRLEIRPEHEADWPQSMR